jgi:hypothetical protein
MQTDKTRIRLHIYSRTPTHKLVTAHLVLVHTPTQSSVARFASIVPRRPQFEFKNVGRRTEHFPNPGQPAPSLQSIHNSQHNRRFIPTKHEHPLCYFDHGKSNVRNPLDCSFDLYCLAGCTYGQWYVDAGIVDFCCGIAALFGHPHPQQNVTVLRIG